VVCLDTFWGLAFIIFFTIRRETLWIKITPLYQRNHSHCCNLNRATVRLLNYIINFINGNVDITLICVM